MKNLLRNALAKKAKLYGVPVSSLASGRSVKVCCHQSHGHLLAAARADVLVLAEIAAEPTIIYRCFTPAGISQQGFFLRNIRQSLTGGSFLYIVIR